MPRELDVAGHLHGRLRLLLGDVDHSDVAFAMRLVDHVGVVAVEAVGVGDLPGGVKANVGGCDFFRWRKWHVEDQLQPLEDRVDF